MVFFCTGIFRYRLFIQTWQTLKVGEQTNNDRILWYEHLTSRIMQLCIQACAHVEGCHIEEMSQNDPLRRGQTSHRCHFNLHLHLHLPKSHSVICLLNEIWSSRKQYALGTVALTEFAGDFHGFFPSWRTELEQMMIYSDFLNEIENRFILQIVCQLFFVAPLVQ